MFVLRHLFTRLCYLDLIPNDWAVVNNLHFRFHLRSERVHRNKKLLNTYLALHRASIDFTDGGICLSSFREYLSVNRLHIAHLVTRLAGVGTKT